MLQIQYQGTKYYGWQRQKDKISIQEVLEQAVSFVANHQVKITCAGRTDARVHALSQTVNFSTASYRPYHAWFLGINSKLPDDVRVNWLKQFDSTSSDDTVITNDFHARFSAIARSYRYVILNSKQPCTILDNLVYHYPDKLDLKSMQIAANSILGEGDFSSFRAAGCQAKSPVRTLINFNIKKQKNFIFIDIKANAFLYHMVRNLVGSILEVGTKKQPASWMLDLLQAKNRTLAPVMMPAKGLYFMNAFYPECYRIPVYNKDFL